MSTAGAMGVCALSVAAWLTLYRAPFGSSARRRRVALWLSSRLSIRANVAFAIFASLLYLLVGGIVFIVIMAATGVRWNSIIGRPSAVVAVATVSAILGTSSLNTLWISILYRARPSVDVPGEIAKVQWVASVTALTGRIRWMVPAAAALVEELVFRGAVFLGLTHSGASFLVSSAYSTALFALGQMVLVSTPVQVYVMCVSSVTLGTIGTLLIAATGSVVPALILHASFAGYYTRMSAPSVRGFGAGHRSWQL